MFFVRYIISHLTVLFDLKKWNSSPFIWFKSNCWFCVWRLCGRTGDNSLSSWW